MLKAGLRRLREFFGADVMAALDRLRPELQAIREENAGLRAELAILHGQFADLRGELAALREALAQRETRENALARQMEAALLTIALNRREAA